MDSIFLIKLLNEVIALSRLDVRSQTNNVIVIKDIGMVHSGIRFLMLRSKNIQKYMPGGLGNQRDRKYTQVFLKHTDEQKWISSCEKQQQQKSQYAEAVRN